MYILISFEFFNIISGVTKLSVWKVNKLNMKTRSLWSWTSTILVSSLLWVVRCECFEAVSLWLLKSIELLFLCFNCWMRVLCLSSIALALLLTSSSFRRFMNILFFKIISSAFGRKSLARATRRSVTDRGWRRWPCSMHWNIPLFEKISRMTFSITERRRGKISNVRFTNLEKFWHYLVKSEAPASICTLWGFWPTFSE